MLIDSNVLISAVDESAPSHRQVKVWLESALNGATPVAIPWDSIGAFLRVVTHPRVFARPLTILQAWSFVCDWLAAKPSWVPTTNERTLESLADVLTRFKPTGNLVPDAMLASICSEHDMPVVTLDSDFRCFDVEVIDPTERQL